MDERQTDRQPEKNADEKAEKTGYQGVRQVNTM